MTLRLSELVPDVYGRWYYHEPTGLLLRNSAEFGWVAANSLDTVQNEMEELEEAIDMIIDDGGDISDPEGVLPLPEDYDE